MKTIKARHAKYASVDEFTADFELMFANAQEFNMPDSQVYNDAMYPYPCFYLRHCFDLPSYLQNLFRKELKRVLAEMAEPASPVGQHSNQPSPATHTSSSSGSGGGSGHNHTHAPHHARAEVEMDSDADTPPAKRVNRTATILDDDEDEAEPEDEDYESQSD